MTIKLYYSDAYLREFDATVVSVKEDKVILDRTAFYPGGGGQQHDTGAIGDYKVVEVGKDGDEIYHIVLDNDFKAGQKVHCFLDWERRFELMRGHTGQHILFRAMQMQNQELGVGKVDISVAKKVLFFNGEMNWDMLRRAVALANEIMQSNAPVVVKEAKKDSSELSNVRIKADRITGDLVRIIKIGDFDTAACGGVHVKSTGEIGGISIIKLVSGKGASDKEIQFEVGQKALQSSSLLAISAIEASNMLGCALDNIGSTVRNLKDEAENLHSRLKTASIGELERLEPEKIASFSLYSSMLSGADRKSIGDIASRLIRQEGAVVLLCDVGENVYMLVACNEKLSIDCPSLLRKGLEIVGGKGGGKKFSAMGGGPDKSKANDAFKTVRQSIVDLLASQFCCG